MANSRVARLFGNLPAHYPRHLEQDHPHVLDRLMELWGTPEFDACMHGLQLDSRGGRQGFSLEVMAELMFIDELHKIFRSDGLSFPEDVAAMRAPAFPWDAVATGDPTPHGFQHAVEHGKLETLDAFLAVGIPVDYRFEDGRTPLIAATISGQADAVKRLIERGAKVNQHEVGAYTALHWAAYYGRTPVVVALLAAGAAINVTQNSGDTPLALAVMRGHLEAAQLLLEHRADPNISGRDGAPLAVARHKGNAAMAELLEQHGAQA